MKEDKGVALFQKKTNKEQIEIESVEKIDLFPVVHVADSLMDYQKQLI